MKKAEGGLETYSLLTTTYCFYITREREGGEGGKKGFNIPASNTVSNPSPPHSPPPKPAPPT